MKPYLLNASIDVGESIRLQDIMKISAVIPARYGSTRFEGKPLADILGKPMIQYVYEGVRQSKWIDEVIVATDDQRIAETVKSFGGKAVMTSQPISLERIGWRRLRRNSNQKSSSMFRETNRSSKETSLIKRSGSHR